MSERWTSVEEIDAARARFEAAIPGWERPAAYGIGWYADGSFVFARIAAGESHLPGVVLATVCGHVSGAGSYLVDGPGLDRAIASLSPAEACTLLDHPNLATWRSLRGQLGPGETVTVVFADSFDTASADPLVRALVTEALAGRVENPDGTTTLWRPTGPAELRLVEESGRRRWPPRLPEQPIFYPVLNEAYAERIAREWNVPDGGRGIITRFRVETAYVRRFPTRRAGGGDVLELWVPAAELDEFNDHIVGRIEVVGEF
ncbi:hypothetical protein HNR73_001450 [Phytomonospora endophytica]|uniref:Uncharacterized protein n=1 Tax=Phytomonospora endophytica TaxID=714109 RepID=A0A841FNT2_9ACTN|nr:hypothetical protein [Phytomonospora endophytica]GIG64884.1 hypothetical protein Pen01_11790 [Phytomonospora endophytica]